MPTWTTTQYLHRNVEPRRLWAWRLASARFWQSWQNDASSLELRTLGYSRSIRLWATGCDPSSEYWWRRVKSESSNLRSEEKHELYNQVLKQYLCQLWLISCQARGFPVHRCDLKPIHERLPYGLHLGIQRITKIWKGWRRIEVIHALMIWYSHGNDKWKHRSVAKTYTCCKSCKTGTHFDGQEFCW